jgi:S1-C subfamily serine protease
MSRFRGLAAGLVGGVVGAVLVFVVLLLLGVTHVKKETIIQQVEGTSSATYAPQQGLTPTQIYEKAAPSVVAVISTFSASGANGFGFNPFGQQQSGQALGSGFVVSRDGYILTNQHVVVDQQSGQAASSVFVAFKKPGQAQSQEQRIKATVVGVDATSDVALLKVDPKGLNLVPLTLGDSAKAQIGEPVVAIGNPENYDFSLTSGIVSGLNRTLDSPNGRTIPNGIQTDAAINPGNSGGPLIDSLGEVIGINEQIATQSGGNEGLGFAVPINAAINSMDQLKKSGRAEYAWLGVLGQTITSDVASTFNLPVKQGVLLATVVPNSPADKAGLKGGSESVTVNGQNYTLGGDIITDIDGKPLLSSEDLVSTIIGKRPGDQITVTVSHDGKSRQVKITLTQRPANT